MVDVRHASMALLGFAPFADPTQGTFASPAMGGRRLSASKRAAPRDTFPKSVARLRGFGAAGDEFHLDVGGAAEKCGDNLPVALGEDEVGGRFADGKIVDAEIVDALR